VTLFKACRNLPRTDVPEPVDVAREQEGLWRVHIFSRPAPLHFATEGSCRRENVMGLGTILIIILILALLGGFSGLGGGPFYGTGYYGGGGLGLVLLIVIVLVVLGRI
jgi:hypothetical protein